MNKEEFLKSGLVEQYALGLTSPEESRLVEHFLDNYPEVRTKMNGINKTVEQYAAKYAVPPPKRLKQRILSEIQSEEEDFNFDEADAIPDPPVFVADPPTSNPTTTAVSSKYLFFSLAGIFFIALIFIVILLWQRQELKNNNSALSGQLATYQSQYDALQKEKTFTKAILDQIENGDFKIVHLRGQGVAADAHAVVYWNADRQKVFVKLLHMPTLPEDRQYQVWADVHGKMMSAGLLNDKENELQEVQFVEAANSLNITMEPLGGNPQPTINLLIAKGSVQAVMH